MSQARMRYYLIYRITDFKAIDWTEPTGGIVAQELDQHLALDVAKQRFHCRPDETIICAEVFQDHEKLEACMLHRHWDADFDSFLELMKR